MSQIWEELAMEIILHGGNARAKAYDALSSAKNGDFDTANQYLLEAEKELEEAHRFQTNALQDMKLELSGSTPLIMVHAQDHLMTAMAEKTLIGEMLYLYKVIKDQVREK